MIDNVRGNLNISMFLLCGIMFVVIITVDFRIMFETLITIYILTHRIRESYSYSSCG